MDGGLRGKKKAPALVSLPELAALHGVRPRIKIWALPRGGQWFDTLVVSFKGEGGHSGWG